ncbi:hypothetical protein KCP70_22400 [Salmonella enterica subsp. enterica]|nr:hypothetical protein KCP70_22400 [Salmonella enterica subsp. enterica]
MDVRLGRFLYHVLLPGRYAFVLKTADAGLRVYLAACGVFTLSRCDNNVSGVCEGWRRPDQNNAGSV